MYRMALAGLAALAIAGCAEEGAEGRVGEPGAVETETGTTGFEAGEEARTGFEEGAETRTGFEEGTGFESTEERMSIEPPSAEEELMTPIEPPGAGPGAGSP